MQILIQFMLLVLAAYFSVLFLNKCSTHRRKRGHSFMFGSARSAWAGENGNINLSPLAKCLLDPNGGQGGTLTADAVKQTLQQIKDESTAAANAVKSIQEQNTTLKTSLDAALESNKQLAAQVKLIETKFSEGSVKNFYIEENQPSRLKTFKNRYHAHEFIRQLSNTIKATKSNPMKPESRLISGSEDGMAAFALKSDSPYVTANLTTSDFDTSITRLNRIYGVAFSFCDVRMIDRVRDVFTVQSAFPVAQFVAASTKPDTVSGTYGQITKTVKKAMALASIAIEALDDAQVLNPDEAELIAIDFTEAFAKLQDFVVFQGNGADDANNGGIYGVTDPTPRNLSSNICGGGTMVYSSHTSWSDHDYKDVTTLFGSVNERVKGEPDCAFFCSPEYLDTVIYNMLDKNDRPIWSSYLQVPFDGAPGYRSTLSMLGYPVHRVTMFPSDDSPSKPCLAFGSLKRGFKIGLRKGYEFAASDQVGFAQYEMFFRAIQRFTGGVTDPRYVAVLNNGPTPSGS